MRLSEIEKKARSLGVKDTWKYSKKDLIKAVQRQEGNYVIQLIVLDAKGLASSPDTVTVSTINSAPIADAGLDQSVTSLGTVITLGGKSWDPDGDSISYSWIMVSKPDESMAILSDRASANPTFVADVYGYYVIELVVTDGWRPVPRTRRR
jgi:hypothetical protein